MHISSSANDGAVYRFGEFTFDSGSHLLLRDGEPQHLSPKAQQVLLLLLENRPRVVTRSQMYDALWPETYVCETNMANLVRELRRALGDDRSGQYIRTVHGFGYAFSGDVRMDGIEPVLRATLLCEGIRHHLYEGENTVGRSPDCGVVLTGLTVSRQHAVILISGTTIVIQDRASRNGTYVRGQKITSAHVRQQDPIMFGAVPATIARRVSSTLPLSSTSSGLSKPSSGSFSTA